ncbi:MAG: outer membrane beta-barrel protein [Verrucomicrobiales bacterium]|nr:outer membrane beta-barrel protein [Verrucomicrobiales bacterium]
MSTNRLLRLVPGSLLGFLWAGTGAAQEAVEPALPMMLEDISGQAGDLLPDGSMFLKDGSVDLAVPEEMSSEVPQEAMKAMEQELSKSRFLPKSLRLEFGLGAMFDDNLYGTPDHVSRPKRVVEPASATTATVTSGQLSPAQKQAQAAAQKAAETAAKEAEKMAEAEDRAYEALRNKQSDVALQAIGSLSWLLGEGSENSLALHYRATAFFYLDHSDLNGVNHDASLTAAHAFSRLHSSFTGTFGHIATAMDPASAGDNRARQQEDRDILNLTASLAYELGGRTHLTSGLSYRSETYETLNSSTDYQARLGATYAFSGRTTLGFSWAVGQLDAETNANQTYQQALMTVNYEATGRLSLSGEFGLDFRQYDQAQAPEDRRPQVGPEPVAPVAPTPNQGTTPQDQQALETAYRAQQQAYQAQLAAYRKQQAEVAATADQRDVTDSETNFVFSLNARYLMRERTALTLRASKFMVGSASVYGSSSDRTTVQLGVDQRIGDRWNLSLMAGYDYNADQSTVSGLAQQVDQSQSLWYGRVGLGFAPSATTSVSLYYEYRRNEGETDVLNYTSNRCGIQFGVAF